MRVRVINNNRVAVLKHPICQDAVQIKRNDDRNRLTQNAACLLQEVAFRVVFIFCLHCAVQAEVRGIYRACVGQAAQQVAAQSPEALGSEDSAGGVGTGTERGNEFHASVLIEHAQCPTNFFIHTTVVAQHGRTTYHAKIFVVAGSRIERRDFLLAFSDENSRHGRFT